MKKRRGRRVAALLVAGCSLGGEAQAQSIANNQAASAPNRRRQQHQHPDQ